MDADRVLREQLVNLLVERQAHMIFEDAVAGFPIEHINSTPPDVEYTFWHLLEHIRICQWDILDYVRNPQYVSPNFPDDLWKPKDAQTDQAGWQQTINDFLADRQALVEIVRDTTNDLHAQIPHAYPGHNLLREVIIVGQHNAYHIGEFAILRQTLGLW